MDDIVYFLIMKSILFQLVLLHAALIWGFGPGGRGRSFAGQPDVADSKKPSFGGDGFPACAVSFSQ